MTLRAELRQRYLVLKESECYHLVHWRDEDLVSVVPDTNETRIEGAEADDDCLVKWGKERYSAEIVASGSKMEMQMQEAALVKEKREKPVRPAAVHETPSTKRKKLPHQASKKEKAKASKPKGRTLDFAAPWNESGSQVEASAITSSVVSATNPFEPTPLPQSSLAQSHQSLPPFCPLTPLPQSDVSQVVEAVQKMEAGIVAAINNLKEALLGKLDAFARPSWSASTHWDDSASPVPRTSAADQEASTLAFQQPQSMPQPPPLSRPFASPCTSNGDSPRCLPIWESQNHLPSSEIENSHLRPPKLTVQLHHNLTAESKIHTLALKLATESFFGIQVMACCTVTGCATYKGLPINELKSNFYLVN
eukprot:Em0004g1424a